MIRKTNEQQIKTLLKNITLIRKQNKLSKKKMAHLLNIGIESLNKIERGELPPRLRIDVLFYIEKHFGIPCKNQFIDIQNSNVNGK